MNQPCQYCERGLIAATKILCPHCNATGIHQEQIIVEPQESNVQKVVKAVKKAVTKKK